jgi:hypothetical protein
MPLGYPNNDRKMFVSIFVNINPGLGCKTFTIVPYDRNGSSLYYKTTIQANLALARIVNYYLEVNCKLKHTLRS